jgi:hypothetical protein
LRTVSCRLLPADCLLPAAACLLPSAICISAPDEMNNLNSVTIANFSLLPIRTSNDLAIHFDRDSLGRKRQLLNQLAHSQRGDAKLALFTIDLN